MHGNWPPGAPHWCSSIRIIALTVARYTSSFRSNCRGERRAYGDHIHSIDMDYPYTSATLFDTADSVLYCLQSLIGRGPQERYKECFWAEENRYWSKATWYNMHNARYVHVLRLSSSCLALIRNGHSSYRQKTDSNWTRTKLKPEKLTFNIRHNSKGSKSDTQYTLWTIKRWQNICGHNFGKSWWIIRLTPKSRPNNNIITDWHMTHIMGQMSVRPPSVRPQKVFPIPMKFGM